jgi:AcrR family transcriptional regulator
MPRERFYNLKPEKKEKIINAFLEEFCLKHYDDASVSSVVKKLGIAKGSIYQYFEDKLELFVYIASYCTELRQKYTLEIRREEFIDFWDFFREMFRAWFKFDTDYPLESRFLKNLIENLNSPSVEYFHQHYINESLTLYENFIDYELSIGEFRKDLDKQTMSHFLFKNSQAILDQIEFENQALANDLYTPLYGVDMKNSNKILNSYIKLLQKALTNN